MREGGSSLNVYKRKPDRWATRGGENKKQLSPKKVRNVLWFATWHARRAARPGGTYLYGPAARYRYAAATHLVVGGTDVRTATGVIGQATADITLSICAHVVHDVQRATIDGLSEQLERISFIKARRLEANRLKTLSPGGHGPHESPGGVARRPQSYGFPSSHVANHTRGACHSNTNPDVTGH